MTDTGLANQREILACFTIDDPLIRQRYGPLDYAKLLEEMKIHNFFTEISFIPWNYRRSDITTARLFSDNPDFYAICVHGCNHTWNEFGVHDYHKLADLSSTAIWRMEQHKKLTGLTYDPVMVFPQGLFSSIAIKILKDHGYLAAFNSTLRATDGEEPPSLEFQSPATFKYSGFPLFLRRYPSERTKFLHDIAIGRPIVIVEHLSTFRKGYKTITALVDWINNLGIIKWTSLSHIAEHYLEKRNTMNVQSFYPAHYGLIFKARIALRRFLSEFRDAHVLQSSMLGKLYNILRG